MYMLKVMKNEKGNEVFAKERQGKGFVYLAKSEDGKIGTVSKDWILKHQKQIVNLGVSGDSIYPVSADKLVKCSLCGEKHKKSTMTPVCDPVTKNYETRLIPNGEMVCRKCVDSDKVEEFKEGVITEVRGIPIEKIRKVYNIAIEEAQESWREDFIYSGCNDSAPYLEVGLRLLDSGKVKWYYDIDQPSGNNNYRLFNDNGCTTYEGNGFKSTVIATGTTLNLGDIDGAIDPGIDDDSYLELKDYDFDREREIEEELEDEDLEDEERAELLKEKKELLETKAEILEGKEEELEEQEKWIKEGIDDGWADLDIKDFSDVISEFIRY